MRHDAFALAVGWAGRERDGRVGSSRGCSRAERDLVTSHPCSVKVPRAPRNRRAAGPRGFLSAVGRPGFRPRSWTCLRGACRAPRYGRIDGGALHGVGDAVAEVDSERDEGGAPVVGVSPVSLCAGDREVQQLAG